MSRSNPESRFYPSATPLKELPIQWRLVCSKGMQIGRLAIIGGALAFIVFLGTLLRPSVSFGATISLTLKGAVERAIKENPDIRSLRERIKAQVEQKESVARDKWTKLQAGYQYTWFNESPYIKFKDFGLLGEVPFGKSREVHWYVQLTQPIFTGFALSTSVELASLGIDVKRVEYELGCLDLRFEAKRSFFALLMAQGGLRVARDEVKALEAHLKEAKAFFEQGLIAKNDLLRAEVAYRASLQRLEEARSQVKTLTAYLDSILDLPLDTRLKLKEIESVPKIDLSLDQLKEMALQNRPELKAAALSIRQARLEGRLAKSSLYPQLSLVGRYEQVGDDLLANRNDFTNSENALLILEAKWNLFEWGKTLHQMKEASYKANAMEEKARSLTNRVFYEIEKAKNTLLAKKKNMDTAKAAIKKAREDLRLTKLQFEEQLASTSDVLDARRYLTEAETNLLRARYGYLTALAMLERAVGVDFIHYGE